MQLLPRCIILFCVSITEYCLSLPAPLLKQSLISFQEDGSLRRTKKVTFQEGKRERALCIENKQPHHVCAACFLCHIAWSGRQELRGTQWHPVLWPSPSSLRKRSLAGESFDLRAKLGSLYFAECLMPLAPLITSCSKHLLGAGCVPGTVLGTVGIKDGLKLESVLFAETHTIQTTTWSWRGSWVTKWIPWEFLSSLQVLGACL